MLRRKSLAVALLALAAIGLALPNSAEAGRYRRVVRRAYTPVVVAPAVRVRAPYTRVGVGYRGVVVRAPFVGVSVGW